MTKTSPKKVVRITAVAWMPRIGATRAAPDGPRGNVAMGRVRGAPIAEHEEGSQHHVSDEGGERQQALRQHRTAAHGKRVRFNIELLRRRGTADQTVPSRNRSACDRDEQDGPDGTQDPLRVVEERSRGELDRNVRKGRRERTDDDQDDRGVGGVKRKIVRRLDESRGGEDRREVKDQHADAPPDRDVPGPPWKFYREDRAEVQAQDHEGQPDARHREDVHLDSIQQLTAKQPGDEDSDRRDERRPVERVPEHRDEGDERRRDDDEVAQDEGQEVRAPLRPRELIGNWPEGAAFLADREHHRAIVLQPPNEEIPTDDPEEGGKPTVGDADERTQDGAEGCDAFELIAPQDVTAHREIFNPVHVHVSGRRLLRVGPPDVPVDPLAIAPIGARGDRDRCDDPQKRRFEYACHATPPTTQPLCDWLSRYPSLAA